MEAEQVNATMSITSELETRLRERNVRVEERLAILRLLTEDSGDGEEQIRRRVAELEQRIREAARKVQGDLR
jgi:hypothetical protein